MQRLAPAPAPAPAPAVPEGEAVPMSPLSPARSDVSKGATSVIYYFRASTRRRARAGARGGRRRGRGAAAGAGQGTGLAAPPPAAAREGRDPEGRLGPVLVPAAARRRAGAADHGHGARFLQCCE